MTDVSGAVNISSDFDGKTLLLQCEINEYVYISGLEISKFKTDDKIVYGTSLMGDNMMPYTFAVGKKYTQFISTQNKFIENDKIEQETLLNATNDSLDPFDFHLAKCGVDTFKKLEYSQIHSFDFDIEDYTEEVENDLLAEEDEEVETIYYIGTNEVVNIFNQKCVICYEKDSVYSFRQFGHQCICEQRYQNRGGNDILKCVFCRT